MEADEASLPAQRTVSHKLREGTSCLEQLTCAAIAADATQTGPNSFLCLQDLLDKPTIVHLIVELSS